MSEPFEKIRDGQWTDTADRLQIGCCDCGLVHNVEFRIGPFGQLQRRLFRNTRATRALRASQEFVMKEQKHVRRK